MTKKIIEIPLDVDLLPTKVLQAGSIECLYEKGNLRYMRSGNTELVRMIYVAVRDENWNTASYEIQDESIEANDNGFNISYTAIYSFTREVYKAKVWISGDQTGRISFSMQGEALNNFLSNRIGICVLHPLQSSCGRSVTITHPDNVISKSTYPELVAPHQPFVDIAAMEWQPIDNITVSLQFTGDVFETEDQRNWSDGSFKTYSTPLAHPFPVNVNAGAMKQQSVLLSLKTINENAVIPSVSEGSTEQQLKIQFPKIGFTHHDTDKSYDISLLKHIPIDFYHLTLSIKSSTWREQIKFAIKAAKELTVKLIVVIKHSGNESVTVILSELSKAPDLVHSLSLADENDDRSNESMIQHHADEIKTKLPHTLTSYTSTGHFAELNRNWPKGTGIDIVSFPINPQAHAVDMRTMVDNLLSHADLIKTTQTFARGIQIHVGPIFFSETIKRLRSTQFASWWILTAIANLGSADTIIIGPAFGENGLIRKGNGVDYELTALYKILRDIKKFNPQFIVKSPRMALDSELILENDKSERMVIRLKYSF